MTVIERRCDVAGCPKATDHFPVVQLVLPMEMRLAAALLQAFADACQSQGLEGVLPQGVGDHGNGRLYAATRPAGGGHG